MGGPRIQPDPDIAFLLETEALYHRLFTEPDVAKLELFARFQSQLLGSRTDRCEALLRAALDYDSSDPCWRATVLAHAGKMYLARNRYRLAEERLREAKTLVSLDDEDCWLAVTISLALAKCHRLQGHFDAVRAEMAALGNRSEVHPVVVFQQKWFGSLEAASKGHLGASADLAREARRQLGSLLRSPSATEHANAAESFGLGPLPRKRIHIVRLEADLARRRGDYVAAAKKIAAAIEGYRRDPEDAVIDYAKLVQAQVVRQEGAAGALELAEEARQSLAERQPRDLPGAARALRCLAQVWLQSEDPQRARPFLEQLVEMEPGLYPSGRPLALFGLGELERLQGRLSEARHLYRLSEQSAERVDCLEHCYGQLGVAELNRLERAHEVPGDIQLLLSRPGALEHPSLEFSAALVGVRAFGRESDHVNVARRATERFARRPGAPNWERDVLETTLESIDAGAPLPPLRLNLP